MRGVKQRLSGPTIVTDTDMSAKIATGRYPITVSIDKIMSAPVITVLENVSLAEAQLLMLKNNVSHLCVTQDGSNKSVVKGVMHAEDEKEDGRVDQILHGGVPCADHRNGRDTCKIDSSTLEYR